MDSFVPLIILAIINLVLLFGIITLMRKHSYSFWEEIDEIEQEKDL